MLCHPGSNQPYQPTLRHWVSCFMRYDMPPALDAELSRYNPNADEDRDYLIRQHCLARPHGEENFRHRRRLVEVLQKALADPDHDFQQVWEDDEDDYEDSQWPSAWPARIENSRDFFQRLLNAAQELWRDDLIRASLPSLAHCRALPERDLGTYDWLFAVDNPEAWKAVFGMAASPYDLATRGPVFQGEQLSLHLAGALTRLTSRPSTWPDSQAPTHCAVDLTVQGISDLAVSGTRFDGRARTRITAVPDGYFLQLKIGFDGLIECVALSVSISNVQGSREETQP